MQAAGLEPGRVRRPGGRPRGVHPWPRDPDLVGVRAVAVRELPGDGGVPDGARHEVAIARHRGGDEVGVAQKGEVVHGHDAGRPPARRQDEVGGMEHVASARQPLHRRKRSARPGGLQEAGGHPAP